MAEPQTTQDIISEMAAFLSDHHAVSLATVDADGHPHTINLLYSLDGLTLLWTPGPRNRHSRHIEDNGAVCHYRRARLRRLPCHPLRAGAWPRAAHRLPGRARAGRAALRARHSFLDQLAKTPPTRVKLRRARCAGACYRRRPQRIVMIYHPCCCCHESSLIVAADGAPAVARADGH